MSVPHSNFPAYLVDRDFYSKECGSLFLTDEEAYSHFIEKGQFAALNPSPFFMWSWIRLQVEESKRHVACITDKCYSELTSHPFLTISLRSLVIANNGKEAVGKLYDLKVREAPLLNSVLIEIPTKWLDDNIKTFLDTFTSRRPTVNINFKWFSFTFYLIAYPDVKRSGENAFLHYISNGWTEGRDPSQHFSTRKYQAAYQDVGHAGSVPLIHFLKYGLAEGRICESSDELEAIAKSQMAQLADPSPFVEFNDVNQSDLKELSEFFGECSLIIVIPFYKNHHLVSICLGSLLENVAELTALGAGIVCVNDSPDDIDLAEELAIWSNRLAKAVPRIGVVLNKENSGFVTSSNLGLKLAREIDIYCLLLNSDTIVQSGAIRELMRISALDDKFAFINPRSNNATISTIGGVNEATEEWISCFENFSRTLHRVPDYTIVPVVVGFCLLIRPEVLQLFGFLDFVYGKGYNEENDLIMRANRFGFVSVIANKSFVAHIGKQSFNLLGAAVTATRESNEKLFFARYPEYIHKVRSYFCSNKYHAYNICTNGGKKFDVIIDLDIPPGSHNGTSKLSKELIPHIVTRMPECRFGLLANEHTLSELFVSAPGNVAIATERDVAELAFRFSQPFSQDAVLRVFRQGVRTGFFMLDPIALDCSYLCEDNLEALWRRVCALSDMLIFNSDYTRDKFIMRFNVSSTAVTAASEHSYDFRDYRSNSHNIRAFVPKSPNVVLFGNSYIHKGLRPAVENLSHKKYHLVVFGMDFPTLDISCVPSGSIPENDMEELWKWADIVVFPSLYEGFGFPVVEALGRGKALIVHDNVRNRFMWQRLGKPKHLVFFSRFSDINELVEGLIGSSIHYDESISMGDNWERSSREVVSAIRRTLELPVLYNQVLGRLDTFS